MIPLDEAELFKLEVQTVLGEIKRMPPLERFAALDALEAELNRTSDTFRRIAVDAWNEWWDSDG